MLDLTKQSSERKVNRKNFSFTKDMFLLNIMTFYFVSKAF